MVDFDQLISQHRDKLHEFQHERLIHLLVTFFFAGLLLFFCTTSVLLGQLPQGLALAALSSLITLILLIVDLFYVYHYYQLENGVQRLGVHTETLYALFPEHKERP